MIKHTVTKPQVTLKLDGMSTISDHIIPLENATVLHTGIVLPMNDGWGNGYMICE